jgi:uncharacterized Tic20 family protein
MVENDENTVGETMESPGDTSQLSEKDAHTWGMACHLAGLAMFVPIGFGQIIGPLIVWLVKRAEHPFVDEQGKEALNFQISMTIYMLVAGIVTCVLFGIGAFILAIVDIVFLIIAGVKANNGESYRYPLTIRLIK